VSICNKSPRKPVPAWWAAAVIIYNNVDGSFEGTLGTAGSWVPVVSLAKADGEALKELGTPNITLVNSPITSASSYITNDGTSMAAPHVAGVAGLLLTLDPGLNYAEIKAALIDTVDKIPFVSDKMVSGGRLNALKALCSISSVPGDLTYNKNVGLDDAILGFQVLSGLNPYINPSYLPLCTDVNADGKIGLAEVIYILQEVAEMRSP